MEKSEIQPILHIIMRKDIPDMNPGKGMAQACHAQADFDHWVRKNINSSHIYEAMLRWCQSENESFGVTLVRSATLVDLEGICAKIECSGITVDPSYPWRNHYGELFLAREVTAAWAFTFTEEEHTFMKEFPLHV